MKNLIQNRVYKAFNPPSQDQLSRDDKLRPKNDDMGIEPAQEKFLDGGTVTSGMRTNTRKAFLNSQQRIRETERLQR